MIDKIELTHLYHPHYHTRVPHDAELPLDLVHPVHLVTSHDHVAPACQPGPEQEAPVRKICQPSTFFSPVPPSQDMRELHRVVLSFGGN